MRRMSLVIALALLLMIDVTSIRAQSGGGYDLTWSTVDGGGGSSTGGAYSLNGTIGQADAGSLAGGGYTLSGGFWNATVSVELDYFVYLPLVLK